MYTGVTEVGDMGRGHKWFILPLPSSYLYLSGNWSVQNFSIHKALYSIWFDANPLKMLANSKEIKSRAFESHDNWLPNTFLYTLWFNSVDPYLHKAL